MKPTFIAALLAAAVVVAIVFGFGYNQGPINDQSSAQTQEKVEVPEEPTGTATN